VLNQTVILPKIKLKIVKKNISIMDIIYLRDLRINTVIGIYDWERRMKQTIILDIEMGTDIRKAANSDNIDNTLNYKAVAKRLIKFVGDSEYELVEALAEKITEIIMIEFDVPWCRLSLNKKGAVRGVRDVGVIIERGNKK
jgi:7,8-dihydroneopterin aldolase/epimerase/oxygenase|tara:strand:+ start:2400 stop:2822 length:423 start_codon:yes stop_codon:yes gene_type:complete